MSDTTTTKTRTITLTGRAPVTIQEDDWPIIAEGLEDEWRANSGYRKDASRITEWALRVRQHADGRAIVYGKMIYTTSWQGERDRMWRGGELLATSDAATLVDAIQRVGAAGDFPAGVVQACLADLPAEAI